MVIDHEVVAAAVRRPAEVVGTGRHTVRDLVEAQSRRRAAATGRRVADPARRRDRPHRRGRRATRSTTSCPRASALARAPHRQPAHRRHDPRRDRRAAPRPGRRRGRGRRGHRHPGHRASTCSCPASTAPTTCSSRPTSGPGWPTTSPSRPPSAFVDLLFPATRRCPGPGGPSRRRVAHRCDRAIRADTCGRRSDDRRGLDARPAARLLRTPSPSGRTDAVMQLLGDVLADLPARAGAHPRGARCSPACPASADGRPGRRRPRRHDRVHGPRPQAQRPAGRRARSARTAPASPRAAGSRSSTDDPDPHLHRHGPAADGQRPRLRRRGRHPGRRAGTTSRCGSTSACRDAADLAALGIAGR